MTTEPVGRGAGFNPPNRFERQTLERIDVEPCPDDDEPVALKTAYFRDDSRTILAKNDSPDVPFTWSVNPYRGCEHGCIYCYARPSHEYLGFSAGLDFESKIVVKLDAPKLLAQAFSKRSWRPDIVCLSGVTDCYQPAERTLKLTRGLLEVMRDFRNPAGVITKSALVARDADVLGDLARDGLAMTSLSITTLDPALARKLEPRASTPSRRLAAVRALADAGVPVGVMVSPVLPGLTDHEIPAILEAAHDHGATFAGFTILRLPGAVEPLFSEWVAREFPLKADKVLARVRAVREGELNDVRFGSRMRGVGPLAQLTADLFAQTAKRLGLEHRHPPLMLGKFSRAVVAERRSSERQGELFG